jgi:hypothetical protein
MENEKMSSTVSFSPYKNPKFFIQGFYSSGLFRLVNPFSFPNTRKEEEFEIDENEKYFRFE